MADRSKFTDEEWLERSYCKRVKNIIHHEDREEKLERQIKDLEKHIGDYENGLEDIKKRKWNPETKSIEIVLKDGSTKLVEFNRNEEDSKNEEEFNEWKQTDIDSVQNKIENDFKRDLKDRNEEKRVLMEMKLEGLDNEKEFWNSVTFDNQKEKFGYRLKDKEAQFTKLKKDKIYKIDYARKELGKDYKKYTGKKKVDLSFGKQVREKMMLYG